MIAYQPIAFYDPRHQRGEIPLAREQRKLAAILAANVVGYSSLMGRDESGTLVRLRTNRVERLDPVRSKYGSRPVNLAGDAISCVPLRPGRLKI